MIEPLHIVLLSLSFCIKNIARDKYPRQLSGSSKMNLLNSRMSECYVQNIFGHISCRNTPIIFLTQVTSKSATLRNCLPNEKQVLICQKNYNFEERSVLVLQSMLFPEFSVVQCIILIMLSSIYPSIFSFKRFPYVSHKTLFPFFIRISVLCCLRLCMRLY